MTLPRPEEPGTKEAGPVVHISGGSQAKNKQLSTQQSVNEKDMARYQKMVQERKRRRSRQT